MLPEFIEPQQLAKEQKVLEGVIPLKQFSRIEGLILPSSEKLSFSWQFDLDAHQQVTAVLTLKAKLSLECQRCREPFDYALNAQIPMKVVHSEREAEALALELQPLYVDELGHSSALDVIEDELILNIPEFPKHQKKDCSFRENQAYYDTPSNGVKVNTHKPFANLKIMSASPKRCASCGRDVAHALHHRCRTGTSIKEQK